MVKSRIEHMVDQVHAFVHPPKGPARRVSMARMTESEAFSDWSLPAPKATALRKAPESR